MKEVVRRALRTKSRTNSIELGLLVACVWLAVLSSVNAMGKQMSGQSATVSTSQR